MGSILSHVIAGIGISAPLAVVAGAIIKLLSMAQLWFIHRSEERKKATEPQQSY
jgi:hypothetical protein